MDFALDKQRIMIDQKIGSESNQHMIEGDLLAPDIKPDIMQILSVDAKTCIDKVDVVADRISYSGKIDITVLYVSKDEEKPINCMQGSLSLDDFVNMDGITSDMSADIDAEISHLNFKLINDRKINVKAVVETSAIVVAACEKEIVSGIGDIPESQVMKSPLKISRIVENRNDKFIIKEELSIPSGKPAIREILNTKIDLCNKDVRAQDGKVSVKGDLIVKTLYIGDMDGSTCDYMEHEVPFSGFIDASESLDGLFAEAALKVGDNYIQIRQDSDGEDRAIEVEVSISAKVKVYSESSIDMVEDAYSINKNVVLTKDKVKYPKVICRNKNQFPVRDKIILPDGYPKILQVFSISGVNKVDRMEIEEEKVVVEGAVEATVLYIAESDQKPLSSYSAVIPFRQLIEAKGAAPEMNVSLDYSISHSSFSMLSGNEVEARFVLDTTACVTDEREMDLITDVVLDEVDTDFLESIPSLVIYIVQPGDSLWKIAKKYNTSIDDLLMLNEIEDRNKIYPGQKLMIMKTRVE